jgi:hypothetical protein
MDDGNNVISIMLNFRFQPWNIPLRDLYVVYIYHERFATRAC